MSEDVRMSDVFSLPVKVKKHTNQLHCIVEKSRIDAKFGLVNKGCSKHVAHAINQHDKLTDRVKELESSNCLLMSALKTLTDACEVAEIEIHHEKGIGTRVDSDALSGAKFLISKLKSESND